MAVTIREIARQAEVSEMTVSNVLSGRYVAHRRQAVARAARIRALAEQMGYRPNSAARATRSGRFKTVCLVLSTKEGRSELPMLLLNGVHDVLAMHDLNLILARLPDERLTDASYMPRMLRETASDGLLIDYTHGIPRRMIDLIERSQIPAVWINSRQPNNCVRPDDFQGALLATRILLSHGRRHIAYADLTYALSAVDPHYSAADRRAGYLAAMQEAGLEPCLLLADPRRDGGPPSRQQQASEFLHRTPRVDAMLCYGETTAVPIIWAAEQLGMNVPEDLSLVSFDHRVSPLLKHPLATMLTPNHLIGQRAVDMLLRRIAGGAAEPAELIGFDFVPGATLSRVTGA